MKREIEKLAASGRLRIAVMGAMCLGAILYGGTKKNVYSSVPWLSL